MNWYKIAKLNKFAKHMSSSSHFCGICKTNLTPREITKNPKHIYPWGIMHTCDCGRSSAWTNSIRDEKEFVDVIFNNSQNKQSGFCNDLFCGKCYKKITILKNGLMLDDNGEPIFLKNDKFYKITNLYKYMLAYVQYKSNTPLDSEYIGKEIDLQGISGSYDVYGCSSKEHNLTIINDDMQEYEEGEYDPIYNWIKNNKDKIPQEILSRSSKEQLLN